MSVENFIGRAPSIIALSLSLSRTLSFIAHRRQSEPALQNIVILGESVQHSESEREFDRDCMCVTVYVYVSERVCVVFLC